MKKAFLLFLLALALCSIHVEEAYSQKVGAWITWQDVDEIDDSVYVGVYTESRTGVLDRYGTKKHPRLGFVGKKGESYVMCNIAGMPWLGEQDAIEVTYRLDKEKSLESWLWKTKKTSAYHIDPKSFADELYGHNTLVVRLSDKDGHSYTVKFDITGAKEALKDIAKAAGWN